MTAGDRAGVPEPDLTLIVDGANVVGSRPDGWWRDRAGAAVRLYDELAGLAERGAAGIPAAQLATGEDGQAAGSGRADGQGGLMPGRADAGRADAGRADAGRAEPARAGWHPAGHSAGRPADRGGGPGAGRRGQGRRRPDHGPHGRGRPGRAGDLGTVQVVSAPGSGDDEIVRLARSRPGHRIVVTSDRELRRRSVAVGAQVAGPSWLRARL